MTARKLLLATLGIALFVGAGAGTAQARPRPGGHIAGRRVEANKTFGLGLELGAPTGLTGKYFLSGDRALDFGIGDIYNYFDRSGLHLYGDYLWHPVSLVATEDFELPLYVGVGGRFWSFDNRRADNTVNSASAFGVRVPVGISFGFAKPRPIVVGEETWDAYPSGRVTVYGRDQFGLIFERGTGPQRTRRVTHYSPTGSRVPERSFAELSVDGSKRAYWMVCGSLPQRKGLRRADPSRLCS
jgi:hypothetical protein